MADLSQLSDDFRPKAEKLLGLCRERAVLMRPYFTVRDPVVQAGMWRQSRSREEIEAKIRFLEAQGAPYLASCLVKAGPQHGKWATNALPGESWHQWGEAVDCFWLVDGNSDWTTPDKTPAGRINGYRVYADIAIEMQLTPLGPTRVADWVHVQNFAHKVTDQYSWPEIDAEMHNRFDR